MQTVNLLLKTKRQFFRFLTSACALALVVIFVTTLTQVFMRRFLHSPLEWAEDLAVFLFIWITFLGAAILYERKILISIDTIVALLPPPAQRVCQAASSLIVLISLGYLLNLSWQFMLRQQALGHNLGGALSVPSWLIMIPLIISVAAMMVSSMVFTIQSFAKQDGQA
ncbi:TRAP transporter small permease [Pseudohoeflea coraliihabitans]|uniref:TRAP transporter small permease protein n=1 Tax=Pseudohoeflea coraliihabitans TaxID=2860393 RepID=A0ABS6WMH4_9HYPH|nr:TRAP transporter small permease [Pseudohoeflea sp. DP4N28-3]MBW3097151.1 TRAP transporter small permease [Pseudohoeflea sp. DP4N28-3]